ncbi:MAG: indole-3-glycerol phosphate synthase TrpC [Polyangiales bacterium]
MSVLDEILLATQKECDRLRDALPPAIDREPIDVAARLSRKQGDPLRLIAEIKLRSPSAGALSSVLSPAERAIAYEEAGAAMVSVLVDREHFDGGYHHLAAARASTRLPLRAKGFAIDEIQIEAARRAGADAVLLIVRILDDAALRSLIRATQARGMEPIVEVVDEPELTRALDADARTLGVNARDLSTLVMDPERASRVMASIPSDRVSLWFSGLGAAADVKRIAARPIHGALVGEGLMRADDPRPLLRSMVAAASES